jgi:NAD-dependent deacetylase
MKKKIVVLTGAGISAESGIQTFRASDGLWENHLIEDVATPEAFARNPILVHQFYNERRKAVLAAKPNAAHIGLVDLEAHFDMQIITQNVDDLHERAGSKNVLHLHGELLKARTTHPVKPLYINCLEDLKVTDKGTDGYPLRPHIVWFGEPVPLIEKATQLTAQADMFIVIGTSLNVYPAAGLIQQIAFNIPLVVIDTKIPAIGTYPNLHLYEEVASLGVKKLVNELLKGKEKFFKNLNYK